MRLLLRFAFLTLNLNDVKQCGYWRYWPESWYHDGELLDADPLRAAFAGADVVYHSDRARPRAVSG